jgi:hypothetical protein
MTTELLDFPTIEAAPMPAAAPPPAQPAPAKTTDIADRIGVVQGEVAKFDQIAAGLRAIEAAHPKDVIVGAINTPAGLKIAEAGWRAYRNPRLEVERSRKAAKQPMLALGRAIDEFAGKLEAELRTGEDHYKAQLDAEETRRAAEKAEAARIEAERVARHQAGIAKIGAYLNRCQEPGITADRISVGIGMLEGVTFGPEWQEFAVPAASAQCETLEAMRKLHAAAVEREAEAARLEAQRIENERVAAEQAAQQAELDRQAAEHKANMARIAGHQRRIDEIKAAATLHEGQPAATIAEAITAVAALEVSEASYQEMAPLAAAAQAGTLAALWRLHDDAAERERQAAEAVAAFQAQRAANLDEVVEAAKSMAAAIEYPEWQGEQQVLKAEPTVADATDRDVPANTSPVVGPMGAGQAADAAPAGDVVTQGAIHVDPQTGDQFRASMAVSPMLPVPTLTLGAICGRLGFTVGGAFLADQLHVRPAATDKRAQLYTETQYQTICRQLLSHVGAMAELYAGEVV